MNASHTLSRPRDLAELKARIAASSYVVDPVQVAAALLRRQGLALPVSARIPST